MHNKNGHVNGTNGALTRKRARKRESRTKRADELIAEARKRGLSVEQLLHMKLLEAAQLREGKATRITVSPPPEAIHIRTRRRTPTEHVHIG